jgi:CubicO group peptidase (beta-lactamase class C family)
MTEPRNTKLPFPDGHQLAALTLVTGCGAIMTFWKKWVRILLFASFILLLYTAYYGWQLIAIGAAYKAKILCSGVFISKRSPQNIMREDLEGIVSMIDAEIDFDTKSVTASFPGVPAQRAIFRDRLGCTLLGEASEVEMLRRVGEDSVNPSTPHATKRKAGGLRSSDEGLSPEVSSDRLVKALDRAFLEKSADNPVRTRAVVVVYEGRIIAERYAAGISADTALPGWSMTKSVTNALVGILVKEGKLSIDRPVPMAEWSEAGDPSKIITLDHLLRMSSRLKFDERSGPVVSDVNQMLLRSRDTAAYGLTKPLQYEPGSHWHYSSGTTNIISRIIRDTVADSVEAYHAFPRKALFDRIGMESAVMEVDALGTFVGSSFMYATARDWARFGLLYLNDGVWEGERIFPPGWVSYSTMPSSTAPLGRYGAHFWTNGGNMTDGKSKPLEKLPPDTFYAAGYEGQYIVVIPSRKSYASA